MKLLAQAGLMLIVMSVLTGMVYPLAVTGIGKLLWLEKSQGSLVRHDGKIIGSKLLAQDFKKPIYFWPRPSASNHEAVPSAASNLGPTNEKLKTQIESRKKNLALAHGSTKDAIPIDLLTTSASGLDPHISLAAAQLQIDRVMKARGLEPQKRKWLEKLIHEASEDRQLLILGEPRVNVLLLNMALDRR